MMKKITLFLVAIMTFIGVGALNAQTILFSEDFSGGSIPATWQTIDNLNGGNWAYTIVGGAFGGQLASTTAADGYVFFDSDGFGDDGLAENADLITAPFSTLGEPVVNLKFQEFFRVFGAPTGTVSVRSNGGAWNVVYTVTTETTNPNLVEIDISAFAGNSASVEIKFNYVGDWDYYWLIDDIEVSTPPSFNLSLENTSMSPAVKQEIGGYVPNFVVDYTERTNVVMSVDVKNVGASSISSFVIESEVSDQAGVVTDVFSETVTTTIAPGGVYTYSTAAKNLTTLFPAQATDEVLFLSFNLLSSVSNSTVDANDSTFNFIAAPLESFTPPYSSSFEINDAVGDPDFNQETWGWKYMDNDSDANTFGAYSFTNIPTQTGDFCVIGSIINGNSLSLGAVDETLQSPNLSLTSGSEYDFSIYAYTIAGQTATFDMELTDETGSFTTSLGTISLGVNDTVPAKFTFSGTAPATQNNYIVNINKSASNFFMLDLFEVEPVSTVPCFPGVLTTTGFPMSICIDESFTIATDGSETTPNEYAIYLSPQASGIGATGAAFFFPLTAFPFTGDSDLNNLLSGLGYPVLEGEWAIYAAATNAAGSICGLSTDSVIVNFLDTNDIACLPPVGTPCTVGSTGPWSDLNIAGGAPCNDGSGCVTTDPDFTTAGIGVLASSSFFLDNVQAGFDYEFDMCTGLGAGAWIPAITIVAPSGAIDNFNLGTTGTFAQNCSLPWTASESGTYQIFIHEAGQACLGGSQLNNGNPTVTCGPNFATCVSCTPGGLLSPTTMDVCFNQSDSIVLDGTESTPGSYQIGFSNTLGGTGGPEVSFLNPNTFNSFPWTFDNDLEGLLSGQATPMPPLSGPWELTVYNVDALGNLCDSVANLIIVDFLDSSDPLCSDSDPCTVAAGGPFGNLNDAGGAPCDAGSGCVPTDAGFVGFGIFASESYLLDSVQAGFDYEFDMCTGFGAGAWIPAITIVAPSGAVDTFNLGLSGTFAQNCSLPWTASESGTYEIFIHEAGQTCLGGAQVDNGNPIVSCGPNAAICGAISQPGDCEDIIISEMVEGSGNNKCLEFFNPTNTPIDLATGNYQIAVYNNGSLTPTNTVSLTGIVPAEGTYVVCNASSAANFTAVADVVGGSMDFATYFNGNDVIELSKSSGTVILDVIGQIGTDPGVGGWVGNSTCTTTDRTLVRNAGVLTGDIDASDAFDTDAEWTCFPTDDASNLGTHLSNCVPVATCDITAITIPNGSQSACDPVTNTYSQEVTITYTNAPVGDLIINGQTFSIGTSPQTELLENLVADGNFVDVVASFPSAPAACTMTQTDAFEAAESCTVVPCDISAITIPVGTQTACNSGTNTYSQDVTVTYTNAPSSGTLTINGQTFPIGTSPQTETLENLVADGNDVDVVVSFSADGACSMTQTDAFTAAVNCACDITAITIPAGTQSSCNSVTNTYSQNVTVTYINAPSTGNLVINGQSFSIETSPQTETLVGLVADGNDVDVMASFSADGACSMTETDAFEAPANCLCPTINVAVSKSDVTNCNPVNGSATALASGGFGTYTYAWTPGGSGATISAISSGNYSVIATDENGCTGTGSITVGNTSGFTASLDGIPTNVSCNNGNDGVINTSVSGGSGNYNYLWSDLGTPTNVGDRNDLSADDYTILVTDVTTSCTFDFGTITISEPAALAVSLTSSQNVTCNGGNNGAIDVAVTGGNVNNGFTYAWTNGAGNAEDASMLTAGTYSLTVTNTGCLPTASVNSITITEPTAVSTSLSGSQNVTCNGGNDGSINMNVTGGNGNYTYAWTNGGGNAEDASTLIAGNYSLTVTDAGCTPVTSSSVTITEPVALVASLTSSQNVTCNGGNNGAIDITVSGGNSSNGFTYAWTNGGGNAEDASTLTAGIYSLTVTNTGCPTTATTTPITITEPDALVATIDASTDETCFDAEDGSITASISGGTGTMDISWTNSTSTSLSLTDLEPNSYQLSVTDGNNCPATSSIVTIDAASQITATSSSTEETSSGNDGTATVVASGGTPNYDYLWSPSGQLTSAASGLSAGSYTCVITDENDCSITVTVAVAKATSIGEIALNQLMIYPNPSNGSFTVSFETLESLDFEISLFNTIGKVVYNNTFDNVIGSFNEQIAVQDISSGIYFLEISNRDAKSVNKITISK